MAKLYFYYASMNAGKSTILLQSSFNYRERGMRTMLFTAAVDDRHARRRGPFAHRAGSGRDPVRRRDRHLHAVVSAEHARDPVGCVLVDEAQFLSRAQVFQLARVCDELGVPVLCYGLRTDFRAELFEGSATLLGIADSLQVRSRRSAPAGARRR